MNQIILAAVSAFVTLVTAFGGTMLAHSFQEQLWSREALHQLNVNIWQKRIESIKSMASVWAESQKIAIYHGAPDSDLNQTLVKMMYCASSENRSRGAQACSFDSRDASTSTLLKEVFVLQSKFEAARAEAQAIFCHDTRSAFAKVPEGTWWWNANDSTRADILATMQRELYCGLGINGNSRHHR